jgi:Protein of unknown function (DUF3179)
MSEDQEIKGNEPEAKLQTEQLPPIRARVPVTPLLLSAGAAVAGFACFAYPMYVIRPFRYQGARELAVALAVKQAAPIVTILCAAIAAICLVVFWPRFRWGRRTLAVLFALVACGSIWLSRFNVYEQLMFHSMGTPAVEPAETAKIDPDDMVLAVKVNQNARAYPIRTMGYHHIANDWVGGEPIVATY